MSSAAVRLPDQVALGVPQLMALLGCTRAQFYKLMKKHAETFPGARRMWGPGSRRRWDRDEVVSWWRTLPVEPSSAPRKKRPKLVGL